MDAAKKTFDEFKGTDAEKTKLEDAYYDYFIKYNEKDTKV